eukprot:156314_1
MASTVTTRKLRSGKAHPPKLSQFRRSKKKYAMFPGTEDVQLDSFQRTLLDMITNASDIALGRFFKKNHRPLYQFLLRLYLLSLTSQHPDRGKSHNNNKSANLEETYTAKENKIISEWANVLTDDPDESDDTAPTPQTSSVTDREIHRRNASINSPLEFAPIAFSFTPTTGTDGNDAQVDNTNTLPGNRALDRTVSFQGFAQLSSAIAAMRTRRGFGIPIPEDEDSKDLEVEPRRQSIWDGVLDANNVIMAPETPKWHGHSSFYQLQVAEDGLLDRIVSTLSPGNVDNSLTAHLIGEVSTCSGEILTLFVPFLCVLSTKLKMDKYRNELQTAILKRVLVDVDINQQFQFFLNSYRDSPALLKSLKKINVELMNSKRRDDKLQKDTRESTMKLASLFSPKEALKFNYNEESTAIATQVMKQSEPESAISLFLSLFRYNLSSGSELRLCSESTVRDPIHCAAPPLSRIEVRKIMQTKSKPFLCDLYVSNRAANYFEYLSSTVILKRGDDLRRDVAVLHVFRLMNKIFRERGLSFGGCPVRAMTYKCSAISPESGIIELIDGCKPLRLVSALEDTITIAQQFNLVSSAVGSYIGAFVMGVRDRHFDNVLVRNSDCTLFHIDFGFVLGETASVDTSKFAITNDLKKLMGVFWDQFIELGVQAYLALRDKHKELIKYAQIAFGGLNKTNVVQTFIKNQLHVDDMGHHEAAKYIAKKLKDSPNSTRTKFKNAVHKIATIMD